MSKKEKKENSNIDQTKNKETIVDLNTDEVEIIDEVVEETPLEKATREAEEYKNLFIRLQADFENYKKRNKTMNSTMYELGVSESVSTLFPVIDSLDNALNIVVNEKDKEGMELVIKKFFEAFEKLGVEEIDALGKDFNPEFHEAVMQCDKEENEPNIVVEVFRKGLKRGTKVIRPSMVKVSK